MQGMTFVVDNTFSPMIMSPAKWGADIVVHSMTKFMSGASDIVAGASAAIALADLRKLPCPINSCQCTMHAYWV